MLLFGFLVAAFVARQDLEHRLGFRGDLGLEAQQFVGGALGTEEVRPEDPVVDGQVDLTGDEAGPPTPVEVGQVGGVEPGGRGAEREHLAGAHRHALGPESTPETDQHIEDSADVIYRFRHGS